MGFSIAASCVLLPAAIDDQPHQVAWGLLHLAARRFVDAKSLPDGSLVTVTLPERILEEPTPALLDDLVAHDLIRSWGRLHPLNRAFAHGNPHRHQRIIVFLATAQRLALLQEQGRGACPDPAPRPGGG